MLGQSVSEGPAALSLSNDRIEVSILSVGATVASVILKDDPDKLNPLWNPRRPGSGYGHFLCLDGFGAPSPEEAKAGLPGHGEAVRQSFSPSTEPGSRAVTLTAVLPIAQERLTRTYSMVDGAPVLYVRSRLESLLGIDRPLVWAEHATIGSPFLEAGITAVDVSGTQSQTRPYGQQQQRRLANNVSFSWPNAPLADGGTADLRVAPVPPKSGDHTTTLMEPQSEWAWATAIHPRRKVMVAWVWLRNDFPWLQNWEWYRPDGMARGLEFSTQPFDIPRREAVGMHKLFDTPTYRWLPAKSAVETQFAIVYTRVPDGFAKVSAVRVGGGQIVFVSGGGQELAVAASGLH